MPQLLVWLGNWSRVRMDWVRIDAISSSREGAEGGHSARQNWIQTGFKPQYHHFLDTVTALNLCFFISDTELLYLRLLWRSEVSVKPLAHWRYLIHGDWPCVCDSPKPRCYFLHDTVLTSLARLDLPTPSALVVVCSTPQVFIVL